MDPQEALRRLGEYCKLGTGIKGGGYPVPSNKPNLPAVAVRWMAARGGEAERITYRGGVQELLVMADAFIYVADQNEAEKVVNAGDSLVVKLLDRFRLDRTNPASTLGVWDDTGMVKHCHLLSVELQPIEGWFSAFYGAIAHFEIKIVRQPEQIT